MRTQATLLCPTCADLLSIEVRQGVEIDICPTCRGVWLDRDELDKLLSLAGRHEASPRADRAPRREEPPQPERPRRRDRDDDDDDDDDRPREREGRRMSGWEFLKDILD